MIVFATLALIAVFTVVFYVILNKNSTYWKDRNVPYIRPLPFLGNTKPLLFLEKCVGEVLADIHNSVEATGQKYVGIHLLNNKPALVVRDPDIIKNILVKDFQHFSNRMVSCNKEIDPIGYYNLFVADGSKWRFLRSKLSPTFTSGKIKQMFTLIKEVSLELMKYLGERVEKERNCDKSSVVFESKGFMARFTVDIISTCAFGIKSNCIANEKSQFRQFSSAIFETSIKRAMDFRAFFFSPSLVKILKSVFMTEQSGDFFRNVFHETLNEREKKKIYRNDFLDILMNLRAEQRENLKNKTSEEDNEPTYEFKGDFLLAQPVLFFTAGFESSSTTLSMCLYELAVHPHIQDKLRGEIMDSISANGGELTYEGISEMRYLAKVVSETLRKYPPLPFLDRLCTKDYKVPGTDLVIEKGTPVYISLFKGLHYDPESFPMPEKFDPERFSDENKSKRHPFTYIPFGEGPRSCIGMRFGYTAVKTGLCYILSQFAVEMCEKTMVPLIMNNRALMTSVKGGNYLKFVKI